MKKHIKLLLRTLFSNNACVEAARTKEKKYNIIAVIFALFALFFAAMPTCVTGFQQNGGNFIRGVNYSFDTGMYEFAKLASSKSVKLFLNEKHELSSDTWNTTNELKYTWKTTLTTDLYCFVGTMPDSSDLGKHKVLEIFYTEKTGADFNKYVTNVANNVNPESDGSDVEGNWLDYTTDGDDNKHKVGRTCSFIVFGKNSVQAALYPTGVSSVASTVYGDYGNTKPTADLITDVLVRSTEEMKKEQIMTDCATFFDQVYINPRRVNTWRSTGIILGVDGGVIILMGFMVWILTRGKNNPFRIYSFWDGQKIAYYACLTPGILALFGFLMSNLAMMLFILGAGVRVMWLSMRTLRYQAPAKQ